MVTVPSSSWPTLIKVVPLFRNCTANARNNDAYKENKRSAIANIPQNGEGN